MRGSPASALAFLVAATFFMENLDATVIVTALPAMAASMGVAPVDLNIGVSAYVLTLAVSIPLSGWLADRLGARLVFSLAIALFTVASVLCGLAPGLWSFVAARVLQGLGGAMMVPVGRLVILRATAKADLVQAIATITWPGLAAPVLGPPLGGFIASYASWRWIFFLNLPLGLLALAAAWRLVPATGRDRSRPFDLLGFLLTGLACLGLMVGVEIASHGGNAASAFVAILLGLAAGLMAYRHARSSPHALLDLRALKRRSFRFTILGGTLFRIAIAAIPFLLPLFFQLGYGLSAFHAGLLLLVVFAGNLAMKAFTTPILRHWRFKTVLWVNGIIISLTTLGCAFVSPQGVGLAAAVLILFLAGLSRSMQFTTLNTLAFADVAAEEMSGANAFYNMVQQLGLALGVAAGALGLRLASWLTGGDAANPDILAFQWALVGVALLAVLAILDIKTLHASAGDSIRPGARPQPPEDDHEISPAR